MSYANVTVPWDLLVSDNDRLEMWNGRPRLTRRYKDSQAVIKGIAKKAGGPFEPPMAAMIECWVPDNLRRDPANVLKQLLDAFQGTIYKDDSWQYMPTIIIDVKGIDADDPRLECSFWKREEVVP